MKYRSVNGHFKILNFVFHCRQTYIYQISFKKNILKKLTKIGILFVLSMRWSDGSDFNIRNECTYPVLSGWCLRHGVSSSSSFCYQAQRISGAYWLIFYEYRGLFRGTSSFALICAKWQFVKTYVHSVALSLLSHAEENTISHITYCLIPRWNIFIQNLEVVWLVGKSSNLWGPEILYRVQKKSQPVKIISHSRNPFLWD